MAVWYSLTMMDVKKDALARFYPATLTNTIQPVSTSREKKRNE